MLSPVVFKEEPPVIIKEEKDELKSRWEKEGKEEQEGVEVEIDGGGGDVDGVGGTLDTT